MRILFFVTDPVEREAVRAELCVAEEGWEKSLAGTFDEAVAALQDMSWDAVVADYQPDHASARLVNWAAEHVPHVARVIMADLAEREKVLRAVLVPHQFLSKPVALDVLSGTVESAHLLSGCLPNEVLLTLAAGIKVFPPLPSLYFKIMEELKSSDYSARTVGEILEKDLAMTTRLLQVINSGLYSLPRRITDVTEIVTLLGQETVKSLVIGIHLFLNHDHLKPLYFSISQVWRHSTAVATGARQIARLETGDEKMADDAYTAGLLHDIGKLVLANNFEAQYNEVQKAARTLNQPLWEAEGKEFGVSHAEMGAYILGRWGMPMELIEATALHHQPGRSARQKFSTLSAVHIANAFAHELHGSPHSHSPSSLDRFYIEGLGLSHRIDAWRECFRQGMLQSEPRPTLPWIPSVAAAAGTSPASASVAAEAQPAGSASKAKRWMAAAAAVVVIGSLGWYFRHQWAGSESSENSNQPVNARVNAQTNKASSSPETEAPSASPETKPPEPPKEKPLE